MISFELDITPKWLELRVRGHDSPGAGFHAVCGMVSAVSQTCVYGLRHYCEHCKLTNYEPGHLRVKVRNLPTARALCLSCIAGLNAIKQQFPDDFEG